LLHAAREEPWGQTVVRLQSPEGAIIGISYIPSFTTKADWVSDLLYRLDEHLGRLGLSLGMRG